VKQTNKQIRENYYKAIKCELEIIEGIYKQNVLGSSYDYTKHSQVYNQDPNGLVEKIKEVNRLLDNVESFNRKGTK
jgi:hypothetical protein